MTDLLLKNTSIITPFIIIHNGFVVISGKQIVFIGRNNEYKRFIQSNKLEEIDLQGNYLVPGFFDIHTHGGAGISHDEITNIIQLEKICKLSATEGVTTFLPTLLSIPDHESFSDYLARLKNFTKIIDNNVHGSKPIGVNLELFMRPGYGAVTSKKIKPTIENWEQIRRCSSNKVKIVTVAPCWDKGLDLIRRLKKDQVIPSIGHTIASEDILDEAIRGGASLITHLFNGNVIPEQNQRGVAVPGVNEYLLSRNDIMAEIIADESGAHVHPTMLKIVLKCLSADKLITITDALHSRGTDVIEFFVNGELCTRDGDVNRNSKGELCGSALQMNMAVFNLMNHTGITLQDAIKTATVNPARLLNVYDKKGSIEVGKDADLTVIDKFLNIYMTIVEGKVQFNKLTDYSLKPKF